MSERTDIVNLADQLADIAKGTQDRATGRLLMDLVHRLWTEAGLDPGENFGGGALPGKPLMEPVCEAA